MSIPTPETAKLLRQEMYREAVELLGDGYVPSYYESAISGFIQIAEGYIRDEVKVAVYAARRKWLREKSTNGRRKRA